MADDTASSNAHPDEKPHLPLSHDLEAGLARLDKALLGLEAATTRRLARLKTAESDAIDRKLLQQDRQKLADQLDDAMAARQLSEKLRSEALEKVDEAMDFVKSALYEAERGANR